MEIKSSLKKLLTCGAVLSSLLGIGAIGTNAEGIQAHASIPAGFMRAMEKNDKSTASDSSHAAKKATAQIQKRDSGHISNRAYWHNIHNFEKSIWGNKHHVIKRHTRKHVRKHHNYNHGHNALADIEGSIKYDKNHIKRDKRILSRKHVRKSTKYRARKNLRYSYQSLKKIYSFLK